MAKQKFDIRKNPLSWEKKYIKKCDKDSCNEIGEFKAPKSRIKLNDYYYFCLDHIKEYNKSWDFYKGLSVNQIENSMREDIIWNRPSWPLKGSHTMIMDQINAFFEDEVNEIGSSKKSEKFFNNKAIDSILTIDENNALNSLNLKLPLTLDKIKKNYKKLVKKFHPDVNGNNKSAEERFKEINNSYKILLNKMKNE
ncbi:MAG: hypothetical protein CBD97_03960 [Pelagibacteraceae bacterium TMED237]|nr:MAG: hypothetical protein CBD97_03960 [Pelagibacteraceae bacterium TMED237]